MSHGYLMICRSLGDQARVFPLPVAAMPSKQGYQGWGPYDAETNGLYFSYRCGHAYDVLTPQAQGPGVGLWLKINLPLELAAD